MLVVTAQPASHRRLAIHQLASFVGNMRMEINYVDDVRIVLQTGTRP